MNDAETKRVCSNCGSPLPRNGETWGQWGQDRWCPTCLIRYPWPLLKATLNNWTFYAKLTTGELVSFREAGIRGDWIELKDPRIISPRTMDDPVTLLMLGRGMVVHLSHIVWCSDEDS